MTLLHAACLACPVREPRSFWVLSSEFCACVETNTFACVGKGLGRLG